MKRILLLGVPLFSLFTMVLLMTICIQPTARAQNNTAAPQIWVTATSLPVTRNPLWKDIRTDAPDRWKVDAPWQTVASHTQVAKLLAGSIENTKDADLQTVLEDVKRRHFELALEIGPLVRSADCRPKTESYGNPGETEAILQKIRRNGGDLRYIAMDEPFFYGHRDAGGCHLSAADLALQVAKSVASMREFSLNFRLVTSKLPTRTVNGPRNWRSGLLRARQMSSSRSLQRVGRQ
jgi:hypothetical protein